jgi:hypothetical protein
MTQLRQLCMTAALICAFAFSTFAGEVPCGGFAPPPPPPSATGEMLMPIVDAVMVALSLS